MAAKIAIDCLGDQPWHDKRQTINQMYIVLMYSTGICIVIL